MRFEFMRAEKAYPVAFMCKRIEVSRSGFYAWCRRPSPARARRDEQLDVQVAAIHAESGGTYGSPRVQREMKARGEAVSKKRVARIMREKGLTGEAPRPFRRTTDSAHKLPVAANLLGRRFVTDAPDRVWVSDISYVRTWEGWLYLAVVLDLFSRRVVGWAIADHMRTELVLEALTMAIGQRRPPPGLVHHSDRGSQYASREHRRMLERHGMIASMSRKGDCWDNAVAESFFGTLKTELVHRQAIPTKARGRSVINEYIGCFYNSRRRHSTLDYVSPMEYESTFNRKKAA